MNDELMGSRHMRCDCMANISVHCSRAELEPLMVYSRKKRTTHGSREDR